MAAACPTCHVTLSVPFIEGLRAPLLTPSFAFACPQCGARLIIDYQSPRTNAFRVLYVLGAIALVLGLPRLGLGLAVVAGAVVIYVALGWLVLIQIRKVVYVDNRLNEQLKQRERA
jgi:hypothetical protein